MVLGAVDPGFVDVMSAEEESQDQKTILFLVVYCNGRCVRANNAWKTLEKLYSRYGQLHVLQLVREFLNIKKKEDEEDLKAYLGRLMGLHRKLHRSGYYIQCREVALVMLMGFSEMYEFPHYKP